MKQFFKMFVASVLGALIAAIIFTCIAMFLVVGFVASVMSSSDEEVKIKPNTILKIDVSDLPEVSVESPMSFFKRGDVPITLTDAVMAIRSAKENKNIKGIYLNVPAGLSAGMASVDELRRALVDFKTSGKFIVSYSDLYSQKAYYLSSIADKVYLNPEGVLQLTGLSSSTMFYKEALKKLGVEMMVFKVGKFKGAVEPYILDKLSDENRLQIQQYLDGLWTSMKGGIASARKLSPDSLQSFADQGLSFAGADRAVAARLVDSLAYKNDVEDLLRKRIDVDPKDELRTISLATMTKLGTKKESGERIKVLYAEGAITDGPTPGSYGSEGIIDQSLAQDLREAALDEDIKAVVLRVNSPGGSAFVSDQIWHEVKMLKQKKPIVVSMGDLAASGGYYISCEASHIVAEANTLTGSIGIFGMFPNVAGLANKIGLSVDNVSTAKYAALESKLYQPMTDDDKALIQAMVERGYRTFLCRVAEGRKMTTAQVDSVGQGRVWLGSKAIELGLVDEIGGLSTAIDKAASLAKLSTYQVVYGKRTTSFFDRLFGGLGTGVHSFLADALLSREEQALVNDMRRATAYTGVQARLPYWLQPY